MCNFTIISTLTINYQALDTRKFNMIQNLRYPYNNLLEGDVIMEENEHIIQNKKEYVEEAQKNIKGPDMFQINHVCKELNMKEYSVRYFEKAIGYEVERDENNNRWYTQEDIEKLKIYLGYKRVGYTYPQIKKMREKEGEHVVNESTEVDETIEKELSLSSTSNQIMQAFLEKFEDMDEKLEKLNKLDQVESSMDLLQKQNAKLLDEIQELRRKAEKADIDEITSLRAKLVDAEKRYEEEVSKKKGFFGFFKK